MQRTDPIETFRAASGFEPYEYQRVLAGRERPPEVVEVPTGSGKTLATLVPWLCDPGAPRRLVYALPMRSLVEQTAAVVRAALGRAGHPSIAVHVLMGGVEDTDWRLAPERRAVIVGTIDMLLSRALGRGFGESRFAWPVSFGLLNADCRWIFDEVQLMGPARTTSAQLAGLRTAQGTALRCETVWMSATVDHGGLKTVDYAPTGDVVRLTEGDRTGPLAKRLTAVKRLERSDLTDTPTRDLPAAVAAAVAERHRPATRTIVVLNRVDLAQAVYESLTRRWKEPAHAPRLVLLHSRFRPPDRAEQMTRALGEPPEAGVIVVSTQVIEAGVDVSSACLVTETAPFSAMVQRLGRCNRAGEHVEATVTWLDRGPLDAKAAAPYAPEDLDSAREAFASLVGQSASPARLESMDVTERREPTATLRRRDLLDLFDTAPDLSGSEIDVSPFIRADDERTVSAFFRPLDALDEGAITLQPAAHRDELVSVPIGALDKRDRKWTFDYVDGGWLPTRGDRRLRPGQTVMLSATDGGYDAQRGWTGRAGDVPTVVASAGEPPESLESDPATGAGSWVSVPDHLTAARDRAVELARALELAQPDADVIVRAAALHDVGKAHPAFQAMLLGTVGDQVERDRLAVEAWAKSANRGGRHVRRYFRHELVSALALSSADRALLGDDPDLVRYLVAAHHGRVRVSIRPAPGEEPPDGAPAGARFALGVLEGDEVPPVSTPLGDLAATRVDLDEMELGGGPNGESWTARACALRDDRGPFVLAYLEAIVRIADWRASA